MEKKGISYLQNLYHSLYKRLDKIKQKKSEKKCKKVFDAACSEAELLISKCEKFPNDTLLSKQQYLGIINGLWSSIYRSVIINFVYGMENKYKTFNLMTEEEYNQIKPILEEWMKKAQSQSKYILRQEYEDFKSSLYNIQTKHPEMFKNNLLIGWEKYLWDQCFQQFYDRTLNLSKRVETILNNQNSKISIMINSNYSSISPFEFEKIIADLFKKMGYEAKVTPKTGDYGVDVVAKDDKDVIAIQAKRYRKGNNVGNRDVQRLLGAMQLSSIKANKAILITSSDFTIQAKKQAEGTPLELWNATYLNDLIRKYLL